MRFTNVYYQMMDRLTKKYCCGTMLSEFTTVFNENEYLKNHQRTMEAILEYRELLYKNADIDPFIKSLKDKYAVFKKDRRDTRTVYFAFLNELSCYPLDSRSKLILFLGAKCSKCSNANLEYLEIDHVNGDGWEDRRHFKNANLNIWSYYLMFLEEAAEKLQLLCIDCHRLKTKESGDAWRRRPEDSKLEVIQN